MKNSLFAISQPFQIFLLDGKLRFALFLLALIFLFSDVSEEDFKAKIPHKHLEPPTTKAPSVNPDPEVTGNTWTVSLNLTDLPTTWSDIRIGVDHSKRLIIPQGKFQRTVTRPDGIKIKSSNIWSKEISVPDIVEMKPSIKFHNNVLKIECDLKPVSLKFYISPSILTIIQGIPNSYFNQKRYRRFFT